MKNKKLSEKLVRKVRDTVKVGLVCGVGLREPGQMCVEAAVCYAYGLPHGDNPPCVGRAVRQFKIVLNDASWSSNEARAKGMLALSVAQLNSNVIDQTEFVKLLVPRITRMIKSVTKGSKSYYAAQSAYYAEYAAQSAAESTEYAKYAAESAAKYAAEYAAEYAQYAADSAKSAKSAQYGAEYDKVLIRAAKICLNVLKELKSPGCEYLYLINEK